MKAKNFIYLFLTSIITLLILSCSENTSPASKKEILLGTWRLDSAYEYGSKQIYGNSYLRLEKNDSARYRNNLDSLNISKPYDYKWELMKNETVLSIYIWENNMPVYGFAYKILKLSKNNMVINSTVYDESTTNYYTKID